MVYELQGKKKANLNDEFIS